MISSLHDLRLLVVADDPLARAGLAGLLAAQPGCQIVGQSAADSDWPVELASAQPDVIVWDLGWTAGNSLERLAELSDTTPPILALLPEADADAGTAVSAWRAGARGLLMRAAVPAAIIAAAQSLAEGLIALDRDLAADLLQGGSVEHSTDVLVDALTPRELEVLQLLAEGLTNRAIAQRLEISEHTVKFHVNAILGKLAAQSRTDAVVRATRLGLILL